MKAWIILYLIGVLIVIAKCRQEAPFKSWVVKPRYMTKKYFCFRWLGQIGVFLGSWITICWIFWRAE